MAFVTTKNRTSNAYKFSVYSLDDPSLEQLKIEVKYMNNQIRLCNKYKRKLGLKGDIPSKTLAIRPRGKRPHSYSHDTPKENATHFDVYVHIKYKH